MASSSSLVKWVVDPRRNFLAALHKKSLDKRLRKYGLRLDDLYDPKEDLDIQEAFNRLPHEIVDARNQRLKRAMDLSMKHEYLPDELQAMQTPFRGYLQDMLSLEKGKKAESEVSVWSQLGLLWVKKERAEREALGALPLYQRTIP
ncbi:Cytochrome b-c1 complex subunit 7-2, mitochondrial [Ancistrocladus abbreviatus]